MKNIRMNKNIKKLILLITLNINNYDGLIVVFEIPLYRSLFQIFIKPNINIKKKGCD
jgi:hypothetical protein